jgi:hypothetical protein
MLSIDQPSITGAQRLIISDAKSCQQWLAVLPLTNAPAAHTELQLQVDLLNHTSALSGIERWRIFEHLRESIQYVQSEVAKKYSGKPMPLDSAEMALWKKSVTLWQSVTQGYQICLQNYVDNDRALANFAPAIVQRILRLTGQQMLEYHSLYQNVPEALWKQLHKTYATAEELRVEKTSLKDPLNRMVESTRPESAYVQALLMDLADPFHHNLKHREQIDRWLDKWSARVTLSKTPAAIPHPEIKLPVLVVDLSRATGIQYGTPFEASTSIRHLDINALAATLAKRVRHLRKGGAPAELDMGDDCQQPACETLLTQLYQQWCEPPQNRAYERRAGNEKAQVSFTIAAIHFFCNGGKPFRQPGERENQDFGWREAQDLKIFGQVTNQTKKLNVSQMGYAAENWQIQDESALGFKLAADGLHAARVALNQLIAIRHPQAKHFAIGMVRWMRFDPNGDLNIGIRTFPGIPMAVGIRAPVLIASLQNKFLQGFLLPEIPALKEPPTLVLPHGWFGPKKQLELHIENTLTVRLGQVIERGVDFERITFSLK